MAGKQPMQAQWQPQQDPNAHLYPPEELAYDAYGNPAPPLPQESKRDKRRREMVDRVTRLQDDTVARRDRIFHDLSEIYARTADELLPPPVFPVAEADLPIGQLPPSLPFTDPVIPDLHPIPYLFSLHRLSLERANEQVAIRLFHQHQVASARRLYEAEVERIEDEYEAATKGVVEKLFEGVEERRKRLLEEKEGEGVTIDTFLESQRTHGTRRMRGNGRVGASSRSGGGNGGAHTGAGGSGTNGAASPSESVTHGGRDGGGANGGVGGGGGGGAGAGGASAAGVGVDAAALGSLLGLSGVADPFNLAAALLPPTGGVAGSGAATLTALSGIGPTASLLTGTVGKRKPGGRTQPGLPPAHFLVQSGTYSQFGKSLAGLSALRGEEVEGDLGEMRRKRQRTGAGGRRRAYE